MPVEIKELVIRAVVRDEPSSSRATVDYGEEKRAIVDEVVKQVLRILESSKER